jgi:hypothetical protein
MERERVARTIGNAQQQLGLEQAPGIERSVGLGIEM